MQDDIPFTSDADLALIAAMDRALQALTLEAIEEYALASCVPDDDEKDEEDEADEEEGLTSPPVKPIF